jgi:hypothetical protein
MGALPFVFGQLCFASLTAGGLLLQLHALPLSQAHAQDRQQTDTPKPMDKRTNGLIMLIEFESIDGIRQWERQLDRRGLTALVQAQHNVIAAHPQDFVRLSLKGYPIAGLYAEQPFWDMPYEEQFASMREVKTAIQQTLVVKTMRVFGSKYFAYDENTLKAADALGIEYVLARRHRRRTRDRLRAARIQSQDHLGIERAVRRDGDWFAL